MIDALESSNNNLQGYKILVDNIHGHKPFY